MDRGDGLHGGLVRIEFSVLGLLGSIARESRNLFYYSVAIDGSYHRVDHQIPDTRYGTVRGPILLN